MKRSLIFITLFICFTAFGADPTATSYPFADCMGSLRPYPAPEMSAAAPDSLTPVMVNHVGRHGSRFPASATTTYTLRRALLRADSLGTITPLGRDLLKLTSTVADRAHNYWGALDSLGMAEQRGIASRMFLNFPTLFADGVVAARSSYSPRCIASMYEFTHQLSRLNNRLEIYTGSGRQYTPQLRPFDNSVDFTDYIRGKVWERPYLDFAEPRITAAPLRRILGERYPLTRAETMEVGINEYYFLAGLAAMDIEVDLSRYFTLEEVNALWGCFNLRQYLQRTATTLSAVPAEIASPLLLDLIRTTDDFIAGTSTDAVVLRFGHAETLLPLLSLMHLPGCFYLTNYFDTVGQHFRDFDIVPMAANLQMILFRVDATGDYCVRFDLNEHPITLIPNDRRIYIPWSAAREYLVRCLPLIDQP